MTTSEDVEFGELMGCLERDPSSWPFRIAVIEKKIKRGDLEGAKKLVRESPEDVPIPGEYRNRIHQWFSSEVKKPEVTRAPKPEKISAEPATAVPKSVPPATSDKLRAILIGVALHLVLLVGLLSVRLAENRVGRSSLNLVSLATDEELNPVVEKRSRKQSQSSVTVPIDFAPVAAVGSFTSFAAPEIPGLEMDLDFSFDMDGSFGMGIESDVINHKSIPVSMRGRCSKEERLERIRQAGGDERYEKAVLKGLDFLTAHQDVNTGAIGNHYPAAMTGLTLLSYLGHCETPSSDRYGDAVVKASQYLMSRALKNRGLIASRETGGHCAYEHGIGTYALIELYLMTKENGLPMRHLEPVIKKALGIIIHTQTPKGGWPYYGLGDDDDFSVSGWNIQALKSAKLSGIDVPGFERAYHAATGRYTVNSQDKFGAFRYRLGSEKGKKSLSGIGVLSMHLSGNTDNRYYKRGINFLAESYERPDANHEYYGYYYATQAFFFHGQEEWRRFGQRFLNQLIENQKYDGHWLPNGTRYGGPDQVFLQTNLAILMLEVGYRYLPSTSRVAEGMFSKRLK